MPVFIDAISVAHKLECCKAPDDGNWIAEIEEGRSCLLFDLFLASWKDFLTPFGRRY